MKKAAQDAPQQIFGVITNIENTINKLWLRNEYEYKSYQGYDKQNKIQEAVKSSEDVRILDECFTKGMLNAKIIAHRNRTGGGMLAKLVIMGKI